MAQTYVNTGTQISNFEDLISIVTRISYEDTPVLSSLGKTKASNFKHEWTTQALAAAAANAVAEGASTSFAAGDITVQVRVDNQCQIIKKKFSVSGTQQIMPNAGGSDEYNKQKKLKTIELAKDTDYALIRSTKVARAADSGTAGQMDGLLNVLSISKDASGTTLTEDLFTTLTTLVYQASGQKTDTIFCDGGNKIAINSWTAAIRRIDAAVDKYANNVSVYEGAWGMQYLMPDIHMTSTDVIAIKKEYFKVAYLRPLEHREYVIQGDSRGGHVLHECTLEYLHTQAGGKITNLTTTVVS